MTISKLWKIGGDTLGHFPLWSWKMFIFSNIKHRFRMGKSSSKIAKCFTAWVIYKYRMKRLGLMEFIRKRLGALLLFYLVLFEPRHNRFHEQAHFSRASIILFVQKLVSENSNFSSWNWQSFLPPNSFNVSFAIKVKLEDRIQHDFNII